MTRRVLFATAVAITAVLSGCSAQLSGGKTRSWALRADDHGALIDERNPTLRAYPNPWGLRELLVDLSSSGDLCATDGTSRWCGGPAQGIPYTARGVVGDDGKLCIRVVDLYGTRVDEWCTGATSSGDTAEGAAMEACHDATTAAGAPCTICTDAGGTVTVNTCTNDAPAGEFDPGGEVSIACGDVRPIDLGVRLFVEKFNEMLLRAGIDALLPAPSADGLVTFDRGEISLSQPSCTDVLGYLDDEFADDHVGTDDYAFGPEAMELCRTEGSCRMGQIVTRAMAEACALIPTGCNLSQASAGVIGSGGFALMSACPGEQQTAEFGAIGECIGSPLVLDTLGDGLDLVGPEQGTRFALMGEAPHATGWIRGGDDALLARDLDGDGAITSGRELFGERTGGWAPDGFAALARLDANRDGCVDASDPAFAELRAWVDNGDARAEPHELLMLQEVGVSRLPIRASRLSREDAYGNELGLVSREGGVDVYDVWFAIRDAR